MRDNRYVDILVYFILSGKFRSIAISSMVPSCLTGAFNEFRGGVNMGKEQDVRGKRRLPRLEDGQMDDIRMVPSLPCPRNECFIFLGPRVDTLMMSG